MPKRKKIKPKKSGYLRTIPDTANPVRFFIILAIAVALFAFLFIFAIIRGGE